VCFDVIRRILTNHFHVALHYAMGVTDIDDKIINRAKADSVLPQEISKLYEQRFFEDMSALGVLEPHARLRVSEHVPHIVSYIQTIIDRGHAYATESGVYFDVAAFGSQHYGAFKNQLDEDSREPDPETDKKSRKDFALWKCTPQTKLEAGDCWESPWGLGRPGWHIECSVLTHQHFGPQLDIHSGGRDLAFPHHCNEIAQCESHRGNPGGGWGDLWMHTGHVYIKGRKMSKSLKNFISIRELLKQGVHRDDIRLFCLMYHYRSDVHFSQDRIDEAIRLEAL
jgi:cysteinyl-tRNA synthetase